MIEQITLDEWLQAMQSAPEQKAPEQKAQPLSKTELLYRVVLMGSGFENGKERIAGFYASGMNRAARAEAIKKEYGVGGVGGKNIVKGADEITAYHSDAAGLIIERITPAGEREKLLYAWLDVEEQIQRALCLHEYETEAEQKARERREKRAAEIQKEYEEADKRTEWSNKSCTACGTRLEIIRFDDGSTRLYCRTCGTW